MRSLNAGVRTEVVDLEMRDIPEVGGIPSSPVMMSPSPILDGTFSVAKDLVGTVGPLECGCFV